MSGSINALFDQLQALKDVESGWCEAGEEVPSAVSMRNAYDMLSLMLRYNIMPTSILPELRGGVAISCSSGQYHVEIDCHNDGTFSAWMAIAECMTDPELWELQLCEDDVSATCQRFRRYLGLAETP